MMRTLRCFSSCLERLCNEAVRITSSEAEIIMNSKSEWHQAPIVRVVPTTGLQVGQGEEEGSTSRGAVRRGGRRGGGATNLSSRRGAGAAGGGGRGG